MTTATETKLYIDELVEADAALVEAHNTLLDKQREETRIEGRREALLDAAAAMNIGPPVVLRRAQLDAKDTAIVLAVAKRWADHGASSYRHIMDATGYSSGRVTYRVRGGETHVEGWVARIGGGLIDQGWLSQGEPSGSRKAAASLRPGPRFGGMQRNAGIIYERAT